MVQNYLIFLTFRNMRPRPPRPAAYTALLSLSM